MTADWSLPESWLTEAAHQARVAASLRAEADLYRAEAIRRDSVGDHDDAMALRGSAWTVTVQAARIERHLRGLPKGDAA